MNAIVKLAGPAHQRQSIRMSLPPLPGRGEGSGPDATLGGLRLILLRLVPAGTARRQRPALLHDPGVDIGAVGKRADRERAVVAVARGGLAPQLLSADVAPQHLGGRAPARPGLAPGIRAGLVELRRIDAFQPDAGTRDLDAVAVDDVGAAAQRLPAAGLSNACRPGSPAIRSAGEDRRAAGYRCREAGARPACSYWSVPPSVLSLLRGAVESSGRVLARIRVSFLRRTSLACGAGAGGRRSMPAMRCFIEYRLMAPPAG